MDFSRLSGEELEFLSVSVRPAAWLLLTALAASPPPPSPGPRPFEATEHVEVRLAQFDVVVRDTKGAMATGLGKDDFSVLEEGTPLEVVAVDEWGAPPAPAEAAGAAATTSTATASPAPSPAPMQERRSVVIVFDALGDATALRVNQAKVAATEFVRRRLRPDDIAAVYQLDLRLQALSGVTANHEDLARAIGKVTWMPASSLQNDIADSILSSSARGGATLRQGRMANQAVNAAQQLDWEREHIYESLTGIANVFEGLPGRRILVLVSPGFPLTVPGEVQTGSGGFTPGFRELIRALSARGVAVYTLDIGNDLAAGDVTQSIDWRVAVGTLGMDENVLSDLGLERSLGTQSASSRREFLGVIAGETGGRMLTNSDLSRAFETIHDESTKFYRVSCRVPVSHGDRYRRLTVSVNRKGFAAQSRRGRYSDITPLAREGGSGAASLETVDRYRTLAARGVAQPLPAADPKTTPVVVVVEAHGPILIATDEAGGGALDVEIHIVARAAGEIVDRYEHSFTARVKPEGLAAVRRGFRVEGRVTLPPGVYEIQASVRLKDPAQLATWSQPVTVPAPKSAQAADLPVAILSGDESSQSPLLHRPSISEAADSLLLKAGARVLPATTSRFPRGVLYTLFWLHGFPGAGGAPPKLDLAVEVLDSRSQKVPLPTAVLFFGAEPSGGYRVLARIDTASLPPGDYALRLAASESGPKPSRAAEKSLSFSLTGEAESATSSSAGSP